MEAASLIYKAREERIVANLQRPVESLSLPESAELCDEIFHHLFRLADNDPNFAELSEDQQEEVRDTFANCGYFADLALQKLFGGVTARQIWDGKEGEEEEARRIIDRLKELRERGIEVLDFGVGNAGTTQPRRSNGRRLEIRPHFVVSGGTQRQEELVAQALGALNDTGEVFVRQGEIVTVREQPQPDGPPTLEFQSLVESTLETYLDNRLLFIKETWKTSGSKDEKEEKKVDHISRQLLSSILRWPHKHEHLATISGVSSFPLFFPDGSFPTEIGYYKDRQLWYQPVKRFSPPPSRPSKREIDEAKKALLDLVREFPFEFEESRSAWLAMLLTPILREIIVGNVPMFAVDASVSGSGKGLLFGVAMLVATGQEWPVGGLPTDGEEQEKWILSKLLTGQRIIILDNQVGKIRGAAIERALTSSAYESRVLCESRVCSVPNRSVWIATGNGLVFSDDMSRRVVPIRLIPREDPRKKVFKRDLKQFVNSRIRDLNQHATTIIMGWHRANRPRFKGRPMSSFEDWHAVLGGIAEFLDLPDPLARSNEQLLTANPSAEIWPELVPALRELMGSERLSSRDILHRLEQEKHTEIASRCRSGIMAIHGETDWKTISNNPARLTQNLKRGRDIPVDGESLHAEEDANTKKLMWWVGPVGARTHVEAFVDVDFR